MDLGARPAKVFFLITMPIILPAIAAGRIDLCWGTLPRTVRLRICGGAAGGALHAKPRGFDQLVYLTQYFDTIDIN